MMICEHCGIGFDEPDIRRYYEKTGEELSPPDMICPECGSDRIEPAERCCICRDLRPTWEMDGDVCDDCLNRLKMRLRDNLFAGLTDTEISVAKEKIDMGGLI